MRRRRIAIGITIAIAGLCVLAPITYAFTTEFVAADRCLDSGGSVDYLKLECGHRSSHPYVSFFARHPEAPFSIAGGSLLVIAAAALSWLGVRVVA